MTRLMLRGVSFNGALECLGWKAHHISRYFSMITVEIGMRPKKIDNGCSLFISRYFLTRCPADAIYY